MHICCEHKTAARRNDRKQQIVRRSGRLFMRKKLLASRPAAEFRRFQTHPAENRSFFIIFLSHPTPNGLYFETIISHAGEMCVYGLITTIRTLVYCQKDTKIDKTHCRFLFLAHIII